MPKSSKYIVYFLLFCLISYAILQSYTPLENSSVAEKISTSTAAIAVDRSERVKIQFVGDIMFARNVENLMNQFGNKYPLSHLPEKSDQTYLVGNFESAISKIHVPTPMQGFSFSTKPEYVIALKEYGFTHLGLANNHSYDFGKDDFVHTIEVLTDAKLSPFGDQLNQASSTIAYLQRANDVVAVVGIYAVDRAPSDIVLQSLIKEASKYSAIQIVFVHFGTEYKTTHSLFQENLAHDIIDAGAEAVIGHHPHVVEDIELYKNRPIFYSLGNFIFDQYFSEDVQKGLMLEMEDSDTHRIFKLIPVTSIGSKSSPRIMNESEKTIFLSEIAKNSDAELGIMIQQGFITVSK